jgi:hypothetical protein
MVERTKKTSLQAARQICPMPCPEEYAHWLQNIAIFRALRLDTKQLIELKDQQTKLQPYSKKMQAVIPQIEEDQIVLYAAVEDIEGVLRRRKFQHIFPKSGKPSIKSYTTTTAAPLVQAAQLLLEQSYKGVLLQSQINSEKFQRKLCRTCVRQNKTN